jgi:hypothetical protein
MGTRLVRQRLEPREHSSVRQYVFSSCLPLSRTLTAPARHGVRRPVPSQPSIGRGGLEPERCGSPFLFDRVKKLAFEHEAGRAATTLHRVAAPAGAPARRRCRLSQWPRFGQVSLRFVGSYCGRCCGDPIASRPLSPSTMTSRASAAVGSRRGGDHLPRRDLDRGLRLGSRSSGVGGLGGGGAAISALRAFDY